MNWASSMRTKAWSSLRRMEGAFPGRFEFRRQVGERLDGEGHTGALDEATTRRLHCPPDVVGKPSAGPHQDVPAAHEGEIGLNSSMAVLQGSEQVRV